MSQEKFHETKNTQIGWVPQTTSSRDMGYLEFIGRDI
jgi:hypothetical protein